MIITEYHIKLYKKAGGDVDHHQRIGAPEEQSAENQNIIHQIGEFVMDLVVIKNGLASSDYSKKINDKLSQLCADENVITQIKELESFW